MADYGVIKQRAKRANNISYQEYQILKELSFASKNLYNRALYLMRQSFFTTKPIRKSIKRANLNDEISSRLLKRDDTSLLTYNRLYHLIKDEDVYKILNANMSQQILRTVTNSFSSFFALLAKKKEKSYKARVNLPNYLKKDAFFSLIIAEFSLADNNFTIPMSRGYKNKRDISFNVPSILKDKNVKEIRIIPKQNARFFELQYVYEAEVSNGIYNKNNALAIDLGVNNLMTCITSSGKSFIVDGKRIKSVNQYANKRNAKLKSILDKQKLKSSKRISKLWDKRNNIIHDYMLKSCRYVVEYCKSNDIGILVLGFNEDMTRSINLGKINNQNISSLPMGKIKDMLSYMCKLANIELYIQEESYTSKSSFWDNDPIEKCNYTGKRIKRGLYQRGNGTLINADINGALNILRKSKVVGLEALYLRGDVDTPARISLI